MQFSLIINDESDQEGQAQKKAAPARCLWAVESRGAEALLHQGAQLCLGELFDHSIPWGSQLHYGMQQHLCEGKFLLLNFVFLLFPLHCSPGCPSPACFTGCWLGNVMTSPNSCHPQRKVPTPGGACRASAAGIEEMSGAVWECQLGRIETVFLLLYLEQNRLFKVEPSLLSFLI